jgi:hypothetical protein
MANIVSQNTSPTLNLKNIDDLSSTLVERNFGRPEDYIEIHIYDLNNNLLDTVENFKGYKSEQNTGGLIQDLNLDPLGILNELGYTTGKYNLKVNIQKRKIFNVLGTPFKIKEISSTRTELKLTTTTTNNNVNLGNNSRNFIQAVQNSTYFRDFILNFGKDRNIVAVNIELDTSNPNDNVLKIKLLEPLLENLERGDKLSIVENIVDPVILTYDLGLLPIIDTTVPIKGPNFKIDTRLNISVPTAFRSYDDILTTTTTSSYQKLISKLDGYEIPEIDYGYVRSIDTASLDFETITPTHFENFIHFGSATELLKNFEYKLKLIEVYNKQINELTLINSTSLNSVVLESSSSISTKREKLIQGFSGYEQYLYFESGAYSWPKKDNHPQEEPYIQSSTTSTEALTWLGSSNSTNSYYGGQLSSASIFDKQNPNRLMKLVPSFIGDREENKPFELFCDMVGEHFDPIWTHVKEITQTTDNSHKLGVSKNLVYYMLQNLGIEAHDQFENEDLINYVFGQPMVSNDTSTIITGSNETFAKQDITKEIWKRLYHNAPYLLKTKGTERGLRALINCYGIPDTVLDIKEFGSSDPNREEFKLYTYNKFTQVLSGNSLEPGNKKGMFIETAWTSSNTNAITLKPSASAKTVEFRIKPTRSGSDAYHLFSLTNHTTQSLSGSDLHLVVHPYTGSYDFFTVGDKTQYGKLDLLHFTSSILTSSGHQLVSPVELATTAGATEGTGATINAVDKVTFVSNASDDYVSPIVVSALMISGKQYVASATISGYSDTSGTDTIGFSSQGGLSTVIGESRLADNGTIYHNFTSDGNAIKIFAGDGVAGVMSNISVKEILHDSKYFPVFNGDFWDISLGTDGISGSNSTIHLGAYQSNHLREVLHYTSSVLIDEITNAESFGSRHYSDAGNLTLNPTFTNFSGGSPNQTVDNWTLQDTSNNATFTSITDGIKATIDSTPTNTWDVRVRQSLNDKLKLHHKYRVSFEAKTNDEDLNAFISTTNGQNHQFSNPTDIIDNGPAINDTTFTYYQSTFEPTYLSHTNKTTDTDTSTNDGNLTLHFYLQSAAAGDFFEVKNVQIEELGAPSSAYLGGIKNYNTAGIITSSFYTNNNINDFNLKDGKSVFDLGYKGSLSEVRYYFGELLNHNTLQQHALEPLMYGGNSISSSYDHLVVRYPLSFELDLDNNTTSQIGGTTIIGGAIMNTGLTPPFTVAGTPLLQSHHPNTDIDYLDGFTHFEDIDTELIVEEHHLPTPNTIGKSPVNNKIRIDRGTTDDDILSPDILSQLPTTERQVPDFSNIGVFLSPQNEINEDIIYTLGTFSLDEFLGDPREETSETYEDFKPLIDQYFKKLKKGKDRYNIFDFTRWVSFLDHTLFDLIKKFTPQKSIDKTGILIEPHFLERSKFRRYHPIVSNTTYEGDLNEVTQSFHKNNNISLLDGTSGSAVISYTAISSSNAHRNYNTFIDVAKALSGSNSWEQGPIRPIFELVRNSNFTGSQGPSATNTLDWDTKAGTTIGSGIATITAIDNIGVNTNNWSLRQDDVFPHSDPGTSPSPGTPGNGFNEVFEITFRAKQTTGTGDFQVGMGFLKFFDEQITDTFKTYKVRFKKPYKTGNVGEHAHFIVLGGSSINDVFELDSISVRNLVDTSKEPRRFSRAISGSSLDANFGGTQVDAYTYKNSDTVINGSNKLRPYILTPRGNFMNSKISKIKNKSISENKHLKLVDSGLNNLQGQFTPDDSTITINSNTIVFTGTGSDKKANLNFNNYTPKKNAKYKLTFTVTDFSGTGASIKSLILDPNGNQKTFNTITADGTYTNTIPNISYTSPPTQYNRFYFQSTATTTCTISNILLEEINPQRDVEFDDGLIDLAGWNNPRYNGSKLIGAKINKYNEGDVTYGLNPVVEQKSVAIYFGKSLIGADEEDDDLVTIRNHSYLDIEKIMLIDKYTDKITTIDLKNENYKGINGYIANDLKDGSRFNIELLDNKVTHKLRDSYKAKFNQGYLKKIIEHKGINGDGTTTGEGIQAGYIDVIESAPATFKNDSNTQNVFCYGNYDNTMNSDTLTLKSNPLTRQIWPTKTTFGQTDLTAGSNTLVNSSMAHLGTFINSMLIPIASESQYRLFGTLNLGQKQNQGNYGAPSDSGIKSISTFEIDLEKYSDASGPMNGTQVYANIYIDGVDRATHIPNYLLLPIMQGPHDLMTSGITVGNGGDTGVGINIITGVELQYYWSGDGNKNAIYQISYLEETNVIIADIDKQSELANDVGDEGFVIIPDNIDKDIRDNLSFYLNKAGLKDNPDAEKLPLRKL